VARIHPLTRAPAVCQGILMLQSGEQVRYREPRGSLEQGEDTLEGLEHSSEAETRSRGRSLRMRRRSACGVCALELGGCRCFRLATYQGEYPR
jgi:hypothetical protein